MAEYIDFVNLIVKRDTPEADLAAMLPQIDGQIAAVQGDLKRYETSRDDLEKVHEEMLSRLVEYSVAGKLDSLQPAFDDVLNRLDAVRDMARLLSTAHGKLMRTRADIAQKFRAYSATRENIEEAQRLAAQRQEQEAAKKQKDYENHRAVLAHEGRQDVLDWPESVADYDAMVAEQQATEKAAQLASQEAQQAAREAAETSRRARVKEWVQALAPGE